MTGWMLFTHALCIVFGACSGFVIRGVMRSGRDGV